jgi:hypothetical protein
MFHELDLKSWISNVGITKLELTQAVQHENNLLRLVRGKETLARVFIHHTEFSSIPVTVTLKAYITISGGILVSLGSLSQTFDAPPSPDREVLEDTANFELPASWRASPKLILTAEVSPIGMVDMIYSDNKLTKSFNFINTHDLNIYYINVNQGTQTSPSQVSNNVITAAQRAFEATYPVDKVNWIELDWETIGVYTGTHDHDLIDLLNQVLGQIIIAIIFQAILGQEVTLPLPDQIVGFRSGGGGHSDPTWNNHGAKLSYATTIGATAPVLTTAHEINHNLGPNDWGRHVSSIGSSSSDIYGCGAPGPDETWQNLFSDDDIHALGWDPANGLISPTTTDFMSYCSGSQWISDYRWERLIDKLHTSSYNPGNPGSFPIQLNQVAKYDEFSAARLVSGKVIDFGMKTQTIEINPSYKTSGVSYKVPTNDSNLKPTYFIQVNYNDGSKMSYPIYGDSSMKHDLHDDHEDGSYSNVSFTYLLPDRISEKDPKSIYFFDIITPGGTFIQRISGTSYTAETNLFIPEVIDRSNITEISWIVKHSSKLPLSFQLQYSHDNLIWQNVGAVTDQNSVKSTFSQFPGGKGYFRLLITDGFRTHIHTAETPTLIQDLPPSVDILRNRLSSSRDNTKDINTMLTSNEIYYVTGINHVALGSEISFKATAYDPEDGKLDSTSMSWKLYDNNKNVLKVMPGDNIKFSLYSEGIYIAEVTATDSYGNSVVDHIQFRVASPKYLPVNVLEAFKNQLENPQETITVTVTDLGDINTDDIDTDGFNIDNLELPIPTMSIILFLVISAIITNIIRRRNY